MPDNGFLQKIYSGTFDERAFRSFRKQEDTPRLRRAVEDWLAVLSEYPPERLEAEGRVPEDMLAKLGRRGLFGLSIPEPYGGSGFTLREYLRTVEEMAKPDLAVALVSLAHLSIGVKAVQLFGSESQKERYLKPAASGEMIFAFALTEPKTGSDAQHIETKAELSPDGSHYVLNGSKAYITNANYAGAFTVFAQLDPKRPGFMGAFIVEAAWPGVAIGKDMPKMGLKASSTAAIQFRDVRVPAENLLGSPGDGFRIAMTVLNYGRLGLGAASAGIMGRSLEDMLARSASRVQFGTPIGEFPLIQEKIASTRTNLFVSSAMNRFTASLLEADPLAPVAVETGHCKLFGTTRAWNAVYDALQTAGGAGYLSTLPYEKRMRDFRVATVFEGTTEIHSIYPAIFLARQVQKHILACSGKRWTFMKFLLDNLAGTGNGPPKSSNGTMRRAAAFAKRCARAVRRTLILGMVFYGTGMTGRQYLLRRISTLSLYLYATVSVLAGMTSGAGTGSPREEDAELLDRFLAEAKEVWKENARLRDSPKERLNGILHRRLAERAKGGLP